MENLPKPKLIKKQPAEKPDIPWPADKVADRPALSRAESDQRGAESEVRFDSIAHRLLEALSAVSPWVVFNATVTRSARFDYQDHIALETRP